MLSCHEPLLSVVIGCPSLSAAYRVVVWLLLHQLWRHIQRGALDAGEHHGVGAHGTSETKVTELDCATSPDQDVLRLHVSVDDSVAVKVVQRAH
jgi:hypothetical protein